MFLASKKRGEIKYKAILFQFNKNFLSLKYWNNQIIGTKNTIKDKKYAIGYLKRNPSENDNQYHHVMSNCHNIIYANPNKYSLTKKLISLIEIVFNFFLKKERNIITTIKIKKNKKFALD